MPHCLLWGAPPPFDSNTPQLAAGMGMKTDLT